jgi:hypothetical protein
MRRLLERRNAEHGVMTTSHSLLHFRIFLGPITRNGGELVVQTEATSDCQEILVGSVVSKNFHIHEKYTIPAADMAHACRFLG